MRRNNQLEGLGSGHIVSGESKELEKVEKVYSVIDLNQKSLSNIICVRILRNVGEN